MTLQDKLIAKVKGYFPNISVCFAVVESDLDGYEWVHMVKRSECDHNMQTEESSENDLMDRLNYLNTCKAPDVILIRFCETGRDYASASNGAYVSKARFSLGYKI